MYAQFFVFSDVSYCIQYWYCRWPTLPYFTNSDILEPVPYLKRIAHSPC